MSYISLYDRVTKRNMQRYLVRVYPADMLHGYDIEFSGNYVPVQHYVGRICVLSVPFASRLDNVIPSWRLPIFPPFDVYRLDAVGEWRLILCHLSPELAFCYCKDKPYRCYDSRFDVPFSSDADLHVVIHEYPRESSTAPVSDEEVPF